MAELPLLGAGSDAAALQRTLDRERPALAAAAAAHPAATRAWLAPALASDAGTVEFFGLLEASLASPAFVPRLEAARAAAVASAAAAAAAASTPSTSVAASRGEVLRPEWWEEPAAVAAPGGPPSSSTLTSSPSASTSPERLDSYVLVDRADVVDSVAAFVAAYLATLPDAAALPAPQLAAALGGTLREVRKGKVAKFWSVGKSVYRAAAVASGIFGAYTHPWLARALLAAVWTGVRALLG